MRSLLVLSALVAVCWAATTTTHRPHASREPNEYETMTFSYLPKTHHLIIKTHHGHAFSCYVATLTAAQLAHVHSDAGLRSIELHYLGQLSSGTEVKAASLNAAEVHACGHVPTHGTLTYYTL